MSSEGKDHLSFRSGSLTSRFVGLKDLVWQTRLQQQVKHVRGLDPAEEQTHGHVLLSLVRTLQVLVELVVLHQSTAVQRRHTLQVHELAGRTDTEIKVD